MKIRIALAAISLLVTSQAFSTAYHIPPPNKSIIGRLLFASGGFKDSIASVQQRYNIGYNAVQDANPHVDFENGIPFGAQLQIPTTHLLPDLPREGIVVNLPEMRMYYYRPEQNLVYTYPIGIGKVGKTIPITNTSITRKETNPSWSPPEDIREWNLAVQGIVLPKIMPPGPDNPLGPYAIYMEVPTFLIHSTIFPESIGKRASFGCLRMYESDIKEFFPSIDSGVPVAIINAPTKVAWQDNSLYVESFRPLEEHNTAVDATLPGMVRIVQNATTDKPTLVDWQALSYLSHIRDGIPHDIGFQIPS